ncbi:MAG: hypothetical protein SV186_00840 [Candidatus Nanohaloarchaea archaeon]|nr:hypothetical protein [Candidatus Nanohaloarchaea archaeon]
MTLTQGVLYGVVALAWIGAGVLAFVFYRDFFAPDKFPLEWKMLLAGIAGLAISHFLFAAAAVVAMPKLSMAAYVVQVLAGALLLVAGFILWDKFRL